MTKIKKPTKELIEAVKNLLAAKALVQVVEPIVTKYETEILANHQFTIDPQYVTEEIETNQVILRSFDAYLLKEDDYKVYETERRAEMKAAGFEMDNEEKCPLLVAQNKEFKAKRSVLAEGKYITNLNPEDIYNLKDRNKMIELLTGFVVAYCRECKLDLKVSKPKMNDVFSLVGV